MTPSGHLAFHGVIGEHDSLLASVGYHPGFRFADYIYYVNLCAPALVSALTSAMVIPSSVFQTRKDIATRRLLLTGHSGQRKSQSHQPERPRGRHTASFLGRRRMSQRGDFCLHITYLLTGAEPLSSVT